MKRSAAYYEEKANQTMAGPTATDLAKAQIYATLAVAGIIDRVEDKLHQIYEQQEAFLEREGIAHGTARDSASAQFE